MKLLKLASTALALGFWMLQPIEAQAWSKYVVCNDGALVIDFGVFNQTSRVQASPAFSLTNITSLKTPCEAGLKAK